MSETRRSDDGVRARVLALLDELGEQQPLLSVTDLSARLGVVQGVLADRVVDLAVTETGRQRLRAELRGRRWAGQRQVGVPEVLAAHDDGLWLVSGRVHGVPSGGPQWAEAAIEAALRIAPLPAPSGEPWEPPTGPAWGRARASVEDAGRLVRGGVRLGELRAVRAAARQLPLAEVTHGDLRAANVVLDENRGTLVVLEWTQVDPGPRRWQQPDVGLLWHAVALEQLVARLTRPDRGDGLDAEFARARLAEARRIAADLRSS
jgi:hypothetical protein